MIVDITLNDFREIIASSKIIGKTYENKATTLKFKLTDETATKNFYLDIEKPDGTKFTTSQLNVVDNVVEYVVPNSILDKDGFLKIEVILTGDDNYQMKYPAISFKVENSINATDALPGDDPTLIHQIQDVIDTIDKTGSGTKVLYDDGTYKEPSSGTTDYNELTNIPIIPLVGTRDNIIYLKDLTTGNYIINGYFMPYADADITGEETDTIMNVKVDGDYVYVIFEDIINNIEEHYKVAVDGSSFERTLVSLSTVEHKQRIDILTGATFYGFFYENCSLQSSSNLTRITFKFPEREVGFRCNAVFKTGSTIPTLTNNVNDIKWHGDAITSNQFIMSANKYYTINFWEDVFGLNAEVREV